VIVLSDAIAKFGRGIRRLGLSAEGFGKDVRAVCEDLESALVDLGGGKAPEDPPRRRQRRSRPVPTPSRPVSETDQRRAEEVLKKRGLAVGEE
jgi:hypothetical protein